MERDLLRVVLVAPRNPLNIGAAARAMSNFGFGALRLVNPYEVAFREARSAVRAGHVLEAAAEFASVAEAVADCTLVVGTTAAGRRELNHPIRRLEYGGRLIRKRLVSEPVALLFGSEKYGLANEDLAHCHWLMRVPTEDGHGSMNLGQAVAVCLYELTRRPEAALARPERKKRPTAASLEELTRLLTDVLARSGYVHERVETSTAMKLRRLVRRMDLSLHDAEIWLGMLRQILWKLGVRNQTASSGGGEGRI
ncbi:MAG: RNA methyltransferase [Bryobacteraceae bacterium]